MEAQIKRIAQFLFDNAGTIAEELKRTDNFRTLNVNLYAHKANRPKPELELGLSIYDEQTTHYYLEGGYINATHFKRICEQMNDAVGDIPEPEPEKVRETL